MARGRKRDRSRGGLSRARSRSGLPLAAERPLSRWIESLAPRCSVGSGRMVVLLRAHFVFWSDLCLQRLLSLGCAGAPQFRGAARCWRLPWPPLQEPSEAQGRALHLPVHPRPARPQSARMASAPPGGSLGVAGVPAAAFAAAAPALTPRAAPLAASVVSRAPSASSRGAPAVGGPGPSASRNRRRRRLGGGQFLLFSPLASLAGQTRPH